MVGLNLAFFEVRKWEEEGTAGPRRSLSPTCRRAAGIPGRPPGVVVATGDFTREERAAFALGRAIRVSASESGDIGAALVVPPIKTRDFNFQSISDAV